MGSLFESKKFRVFAFSLFACIGILAVFLGFAPYRFSREVLVFGQSTWARVIWEQLTSRGGGMTFALLGRPGQGYLAPEMTDTIMAVHIDEDAGGVFLISIPRDLLIETEGGRREKINILSAEHRVDELLHALQKITGLRMRQYAIVDLNILSRLTDALGGIDVVLPEPVVDAVSGYTLSAGQHRLSGEWAIFVARGRFAPEGDFFRIHNQHLIIKGIVEKFSRLSLSEKTAFLKAVQPLLVRTETNFDVRSALAAFERLERIDPQKGIESIVVDVNAGLLENSSIAVNDKDVYVLVPRAGIGNYGEIQKFIQERIAKKQRGH